MCRTHFSSAYELAELEYFYLHNEQLMMSEEFGPVVDVHTHLAQSYGPRGNTINMDDGGTPTKHYLPLSHPVDLDVYANLNWSKADLRSLAVDLYVKGFIGKGARQTHTAANLVREMHELQVKKSVLLPIDMPVLSNNAEVYLEVAQKYEELVSCGSVHSHARNVHDKLIEQKEAGAYGIKVHPAVQMVRPDHPKCMALYRSCLELDLPIMWHCGPVGIATKAQDRRCQLSHYRKAITGNRENKFILGHSGALQLDEGIKLAQEFENVYVELASQSLTGVKRILKEVPTHKIFFGSDWPFYHQGFCIAKVLLATEDDPVLRKRVLFENAVEFYGLEGVA